MTLDSKMGITTMISSHPERSMNVHAKFHGDPSNSRQEISLKTTTLMVMLEESNRQSRLDLFEYLDTIWWQSI